MEGEEEEKLKLYQAYLGNDKSMICIGTSKGFMVCKSDPFSVITNKEIKGGIKIAIMIDRSNLFFLVGAEENEKENKDYNDHLVVLYDDKKERKITEIKMAMSVLNMKLNCRHLFIVTLKNIYVFHTKKLNNIGKFDCYPDNFGTCAISNDKDRTTFAFLDKARGFFNIVMYEDTNIVNMNKMFAHTSNISKMALNSDGTKILTASDNGTLIRLFDLTTNKMLEEFRRGNDKANMFDLCFSDDNQFFACFCDSGDVHIFKRNPSKKAVEIKPKGFMSKLTGIFTSSEIPKSSKTFSILQTNEEKGYLLFFLGPNRLAMIAGKNEFKFYNFCYDPEKGGECKDITVSEIVIEEEKKENNGGNIEGGNTEGGNNINGNE